MRTSAREEGGPRTSQGSAAASPPPALRFRPVVLAALAFYAVVATVGGIRNADYIDGDMLAYVRLGGYLAEGRLFDSASSHWSPLLTWLIAGPRLLGLDGLHATRAILVVSGAGLVLATALFMRRFETLTAAWRLFILAFVALVAAHHSIALGMPDITVAALLVLYFWLVTDPQLLASRRRMFLCGVVGGLACLAKAYALPFFLVHFPVTLILRYRTDRRAAGAADSPGPASPGRAGWQSLGPGLALGLVGVMLFVGPWIALLTAKFGRLTYSTAFHVGHTIGGPRDVNRDDPNLQRMMKPTPPHMTMWETPEVLPWPHWSPFDSREHFKHQIAYSALNVLILATYFRYYDLLGLSVAMIGIAPVLALLARRGSEERFRLLWLLATVVIYCGGYLLVIMSPRYICPVLLPVAVIYVVHTGLRLGARLRQSEGAGAGRSAAVGGVFAAVLAASFLVPAVKSVGRDIARPDVHPYRQVAERLRAAGVTGPAAGTRFDDTRFPCFHIGMTFLGPCLNADPKEAEEELARFGARTMMIWPESPLWHNFGSGSSWVRVLALTEAEVGDVGPVDVYVRREKPPP